MSTVIRSQISKTNPYYISKHRYYELKHFCLQYKEWKKIYNDLCNFYPSGYFDKTILNPRGKEHADDKRMRYYSLMILVEESALLTDKDIGDYILIGVTEDKTYEWLRTFKKIPCCRETYYKLYRRFFWILSHKRDNFV